LWERLEKIKENHTKRLSKCSKVLSPFELVIGDWWLVNGRPITNHPIPISKSTQKFCITIDIRISTKITQYLMK